jgi:predicted O-linked N-acetylglucosamine transferase (SPINDLY family)
MEAWARIVERTPNAVIWLIRANEYAVENIQTYWEQTLGMPEERLVFTGPASKDAHIRRSRHAALFMDTEVYGAHSTGTDALWSGVPIIVPAPGNHDLTIQVKLRFGDVLSKSDSIRNLLTDQKKFFCNQ